MIYQGVPASACGDHCAQLTCLLVLRACSQTECQGVADLLIPAQSRVLQVPVGSSVAFYSRQQFAALGHGEVRPRTPLSPPCCALHCMEWAMYPAIARSTLSLLAPPAHSPSMEANTLSSLSALTIFYCVLCYIARLPCLRAMPCPDRIVHVSAQLSLINKRCEVVGRVALSALLGAVDGVFPATPGCVLLRTDDKVFLFDIEQVRGGD